MTAQTANRIRLQGASHLLMSEPDEGLWTDLVKPNFVPLSSANWQGYVSHWAVKGSALYLEDVQGSVCRRHPEVGAERSNWCQIGHYGNCDRRPIRLSDICYVPPDGLRADWFSGELRVPQGRLIEYVHAGWASGFERDLILQVVDGRIVSEEMKQVPSDPWVPPKSCWRKMTGWFVKCCT